MPYATLYDVAGDKAGELYDACKRFVDALPKLSGASRTDSLREHFDRRLDSARDHRDILREFAAEVESRPGAVESDIMEALLEEARRICALEGSPSARDAALVGIAQRIEHDLIAASRQLQRYAREMKLQVFDKRLGEIADSAEKSDRNLGKIAYGDIFHAGIDIAALEKGA